MKMKTMTHSFRTIALAGLLGLGALSMADSARAAPFSSGSTGADGAFAPTQDTALVLPPDGIFNFTTVNIPAGVTVRFQSNGRNTPVVMLATGDVTIAGTIDVSGGSAEHMRPQAGSFLQQGGVGGPGGYDGGRGGDPAKGGASGHGPGGGERAGDIAGVYCGYEGHSVGGGGGGFASAGEASHCRRSYANTWIKGDGGRAYGSSAMLPLVGGSGGGGGSGATLNAGTAGTGGGGGGGALLIASSGKVSLTAGGGIVANGGGGGGMLNAGGIFECNAWRSSLNGGGGGGGSGGIVRILAQAYQGGGSVSVNGGAGGCRSNNYWGGGNGGNGFFSVDTPRAGTLNFTGLPSLAITQIGGLPVPETPSGAGDVSLPANQPNPVAVTIAARYVPPGTALKLMLVPTYSGDVVKVDATPLAGTLESSTSSANVNIPYGASTLIVQATYTLTMAMGEALSVYAQGERVEHILMSAAPGGATEFRLVTVSGKEFAIAPAALALAMPS